MGDHPVTGQIQSPPVVSEGRVTRVIPGDSAISLISGGFLVLKAVDITDIARKTGDSGDILTSKSQKIFAQLRCG